MVRQVDEKEELTDKELKEAKKKQNQSLSEQMLKE